MKHTRTISTVLAAAMILSLAACQSGEEDSSQTDVPAGVAVQVEEVSRQTISTENKVSGKVVADGQESIFVAVNAQCTAVYVEAGDTVSAGEKICTLDMASTLSSYNAANISYSSAVQSYQDQKAVFDSQIALYEKNLSDLKALNPGIDINRLMIGDVLNVKEQIPLLSVTTVDDVTYTEPIACPVEEVKDSSMYVGDSKILTQGTEGEAQVHAQVTYVNGSETQREILSSTTLREPTTTVKAVGTKEKPKTASTGSYSWPIRGRITSYFGGRNIFGSYSYHSGIDISASYGAAIKAADGGTVTFAGYKGSYGYLVIITHDNGTQTYYGHNSSLLVSAGQKVYKGQQIAKAGSTGRSTGTHCHFEVRVNGTSVNPLSYLS